MSPERLWAFTILGGILLIGVTMDVGCWLVNVAPLRTHCATWSANQVNGGAYTLVPCPKEAK